jgi:hypothetical protein
MSANQDITLDILYTNKLKYFQNNDKIIIPKLLKKLEELKLEDNKKEIQEKINEIEIKIRTITSEKDKYYLENSKYLFEYFESKQNIDKNNTPKKTINSFFNFKENNTNEPYEKINVCIQE